MRSKVNKFTDDFKMRVVQEYLTSEISQEELKKKYDFGGSQNIYRWMSKFGLSKEKESLKTPSESMINEKEKTMEEQELEIKVKQLEEELKREKFKTMALNTMIDIAESELKIDIRKKSGAKR
jgi:transposase